MNARAVGVMATAVLFAVAGCLNQTQQATSDRAPTVVQAAPAPVETQSNLFTFCGIHAGMTINEIKAVRPAGSNMQCEIVHGGPNRDLIVVHCFFDDGDYGSVSVHLFKGKLFHFTSGCPDHDCTKVISLMSAHFGKPRSKQTIGWNSREEHTIVGNGQFEVLNTDFAPPFAQNSPLESLVMR